MSHRSRGEAEVNDDVGGRAVEGTERSRLTRAGCGGQGRREAEVNDGWACSLGARGRHHRCEDLMRVGGGAGWWRLNDTARVRV
jgi:hypothetical protein